MNDLRYIADAYIYCSEQPSVFTHIVLNDDVNIYFSFNSSIKFVLFEVVVVESFLISADKKDWHNEWCGNYFMDAFISVLGNVIKYYNVIPSI